MHDITVIDESAARRLANEVGGSAQLRDGSWVVIKDGIQTRIFLDKDGWTVAWNMRPIPHNSLRSVP